MESQGGELSVVKSHSKPCLLRLLAAGSKAGQAGRQAGVLADGLACGFLEACVGDDCLYIGFHLCVGPIFIFLRYPDAMVID